MFHKKKLYKKTAERYNDFKQYMRGCARRQCGIWRMTGNVYVQVQNVKVV